jgi:hypothetical protein
MAKLREAKDCGAKLWCAGAQARLLMAVVFHDLFANALEFQAREPTPVEPFQVRVVTPGVRVANPELLKVRWPESDDVPMRVPGVAEVKPLLLNVPARAVELFIAKDDERVPNAPPSRVLTAVLGVVPRTEGAPAP